MSNYESLPPVPSRVVDGGGRARTFLSVDQFDGLAFSVLQSWPLLPHAANLPLIKELFVLVSEGDAHAEFGSFLWGWIRIVLFFLSIVVITTCLFFLSSMPPLLRYSVATAAVSYSTMVAVYYVWSRLIIRCLWIELLRRHRHSTFWSGEVRGEIGAPVAKQVFKALLEVMAGYVSLGLVFGGAYAGTHGSSADGSLFDSIYFSFVTLGTIGFGDIQPSGFGKFLVCLQAIAYLLYQAVAVGGVIAIIGKITVEPAIGLGYSIEDEK